MSVTIRYRPGTALARRFPGTSQPLATRAEAEALLRQCANGGDMEIEEVGE